MNHKTRFDEFVKSAIEGNRLTVRAIGPQFFTQTPVIVFNQGVSGAQDIAGRAVVLLQTDSFSTGKIIEETLNILDLRSAPAVD